MIETAVQEMVKSGQTAHPTLTAILLAEQINRRNSGAVIAPWELDDLPDEWKDAYQAIGQAASQLKQRQRLDGVFRAFRQKHPTYRKYV